MAIDPGRRGRLDRPQGLAPRGSSAALGVVMLYWITIPALACMALIPFGRTVFDFLYPALACPVLSFALMLPLAIGFASRRYWGVIVFYRSAQLSLALLASALLIVGGAIIASFASPPPLIAMTWTVCGILLGFALLVPFPIRALRLRYWQPSATPDEWEPRDEGISGGIVRRLGGRR